MTTPPPPDAARAAFETDFHARWVGDGNWLRRDGDGDYLSSRVNYEWLGFRAAYRLMAKDAERYRWLRKEAYTMSTWHKEGKCAYDVQKEVAGLWLKRIIKTDDASIDAAIDAAMSAVKGEKG